MDLRQQIKDRAKSHWAKRETGTVEVLEWGATIHFKSPNLATVKAAMADAKGDPIEAQARIVVACATDVDGNRIWSKAEYRDLMIEYDPSIVTRIGNAIMADVGFAATAKEMADDEKN